MKISARIPVKSLVAFLCAITVSATILFESECLADHTVGSGGDAIRALFEQARTSTSARLSQVKWCSFDSNVSPDLVKWILQVQQAMIQDIRSANHLWVVDTQATCAFTEHKPGSPLYLSYPTCINSVQTDLSKAMFVVLHESAHHMGVSDEKQADIVANAILRASPQTECPSYPNDPFNSQICSGAPITNEDIKTFFKAGESTAYVGSYRFYSRFRNCTEMTGCSDWQMGEVSFPAVQGLRFQEAQVKVETAMAGFRMSMWLGADPIYKTYLYEGEFYKWILSPRVFGSFISMNPTTKSKAVIGTSMNFTNSVMTRDCLWMRDFSKFVVDHDKGMYSETETVLTGRH